MSLPGMLPCESSVCKSCVRESCASTSCACGVCVDFSTSEVASTNTSEDASTNTSEDASNNVSEDASNNVREDTRHDITVIVYVANNNVNIIGRVFNDSITIAPVSIVNNNENCYDTCNDIIDCTCFCCDSCCHIIYAARLVLFPLAVFISWYYLVKTYS